MDRSFRLSAASLSYFARSTAHLHAHDGRAVPEDPPDASAPAPSSIARASALPSHAGRVTPIDSRSGSTRARDITVISLERLEARPAALHGEALRDAPASTSSARARRGS